jgi:hypothetical protein
VKSIAECEVYQSRKPYDELKPVITQVSGRVGVDIDKQGIPEIEISGRYLNSIFSASTGGLRIRIG